MRQIDSWSCRSPLSILALRFTWQSYPIPILVNCAGIGNELQAICPQRRQALRTPQRTPKLSSVYPRFYPHG